MKGLMILCSFFFKGTVTKAKHATQVKVYPYDGELFHPGETCPTCNLVKPARSKHCSKCNATEMVQYIRVSSTLESRLITLQQNFNHSSKTLIEHSLHCVDLHNIRIIFSTWASRNFCDLAVSFRGV